MLDFILLDISTGWKTGIMIVAMIAIFYLFLIRPQSQKSKQEQKYRDGLQKGDRVMTAGGIHATFIKSVGVQAYIEVAPNTQVRVLLNTLNPIPDHKDSI